MVEDSQINPWIEILRDIGEEEGQELEAVRT